MRFLFDVVVRTPKLALVVVILLLITLGGITTYAGYLVVGVISEYLDISRFLAGLLLGILFLRLPSIQQGKMRTVGILPKAIRLPIVVLLIILSMAHYFYQSQTKAVLCLVLAVILVLAGRWIKLALMKQATAFFSRSGFARSYPKSATGKSADPTIIDVDFKENKD